MNFHRFIQSQKQEKSDHQLFAESIFSISPKLWLTRKQTINTKEQKVNNRESFKQESVQSEKEQSLYSLKEFAQQEISKQEGSNKLEFKGGEVRLSNSLGMIDFDESYPDELFKNFDSLKESSSIRVLFFGEKIEEDGKKEDEMLTNMAYAMNLTDQTFSRAPYLENLSADKLQKLLAYQLFYLRPQFLITLGAKATHLVMKEKQRLQKVRGKFFNLKVQNSQTQETRDLEVMPLFHPEFLRINPNMKKTAWGDLQKVMSKLI